MLRVDLPAGPGAVDAVAGAARTATGTARVVVVAPRPAGTTPPARPAPAPDPTAAVAGPAGGPVATAPGSAALAWLRSPGVVSVAALRGPVEGEALEVALSCRLRVAGDDVVLRVVEPAAGRLPLHGGLARLAALVGADRAAELALTGRQVRADEAARLGLATLVVPAAELDATVDDLAAALLATPRDVSAEVLALLDDPGADPLEAAARLAAGPG